MTRWNIQGRKNRKGEDYGREDKREVSFAKWLWRKLKCWYRQVRLRIQVQKETQEAREAEGLF